MLWVFQEKQEGQCYWKEDKEMQSQKWEPYRLHKVLAFIQKTMTLKWNQLTVSFKNDNLF